MEAQLTPTEATASKDQFFYNEPFSYAKLSAEAKKQLAEIPDYPLDYNIFIYRGIKDIRNEIKDQLRDSRVDVAKNFKAEEGKHLITEGITENPDGTYDLELTFMSELQDRLLGLLILERHRRDIFALNEWIKDNDDKLDEHEKNKRIKLIELKDPYKYEIRSLFYKSLMSNYKEEYSGTFKKFAMFQNLEFTFEKAMNDEQTDVSSDEELIEMFHDNEDILGFNEAYKIGAGDTEEQQEALIEKMFANSKIIQVLLPLATQTLFMGKE